MRRLLLSPILLCCVCAALASHFIASNAKAGETVELRDGARTTFYGGGFGNGGSAGDYYGWAMAFGDVDGDGYTDFISSSANSEGPNDAHLEAEKDVYLFFGRPHATIDSLYAMDAGDADILFYKGGYSLACADIDHDGYDDLVLADAQATGDPADSGVYIIFGAPRPQLRTVYNFKVGSPAYTPPDVRIQGSWTLGGGKYDIQGFFYDFVSRSLVAGNVNGDSFADIVIGDYSVCAVPGTCLDGAVYVVLGRPRAQFPPVIDVRPHIALPHPDVVFSGDTSERYPVTLALGDLDGDGIDDILASSTRAWGDLNITPRIGEIHCWWGRPQWQPLYHSELDEFDFAIQGRDGDPVGFRMATGDFDGDGRDDILTGSFSKPRGEYRLYFGRPRALWPKWSDAVDIMDVFLVGTGPVDVLDSIGPFEWGLCMSIATGNRDGDRYDDILIGAGKLRRDEEIITYPGGAYLLRGRPRSGWDPFVDLADGSDLTFMGAEGGSSPGYQFDRLGFVVGMADVDDNGLDEIFLAAPFADGPHNSIPDCGEIYVVYDNEHVPTNTPQTPSIARAALFPNFPNPFTSHTTFHVQAPAGEAVSLTIYDARGREIARPLIRSLSSGDLQVFWEPRDSKGAKLPSGVYFVKLNAGREVHSRKILVVH